MAGKTRWDSSNWQLTTDSSTGVSLLSAFGITRGQVQNPSFTAKLAGAQNSANIAPGTSTSNSGPVNTFSQQPANANGTYSFSQLEQIWVAAGGSAASQTIAAAIAMAESSGNPNATDNDSNGSQDRGLWQINTVHGSQSTYNVMDNARAAVSISGNGSNWTPWVTYNNGDYLQFMPGG